MAPTFVLSACPVNMDSNLYREALDQTVRSQSPDAKLCPFDASIFDGYCDATVQVNATVPCVGYMGDDECAKNKGAFQFAKDFLKAGRTKSKVELRKPGDINDYRPYCITITAAVYHESKFAPNARSWDSCVRTDGGNHGAVGLLQYDLASGMTPLPFSPMDQIDNLLCIDLPSQPDNWCSTYPNITNFARKWSSCDVNLAQGATGITPDEYDVAKTACEKARTEQLLEFKAEDNPFELKYEGQVPDKEQPFCTAIKEMCDRSGPTRCATSTPGPKGDDPGKINIGVILWSIAAILLLVGAAVLWFFKYK